MIIEKVYLFFWWLSVLTALFYTIVVLPPLVAYLENGNEDNKKEWEYPFFKPMVIAAVLWVAIFVFTPSSLTP